MIDTDIAAIEAELEALQPVPVEAKMRQQPKRAVLPPQFPRTLIHHEPQDSHCQCGCALKRIGENASEKLDYTSGAFTVERHIRGKWACEGCAKLIQAPAARRVATVSSRVGQCNLTSPNLPAPNHLRNASARSLT